LIVCREKHNRIQGGPDTLLRLNCFADNAPLTRLPGHGRPG